MKFIFPQNYNFHSKLFGFLDYSTAIFNIICWVIVFIINRLFINDLSTKVIIFIVFCFPIFLISVFGFQRENIIYILIYIFKYIKNSKFYIYKK